MKDEAKVAKENWTEIKAKVKNEYPHISDEELHCDTGSELEKLEEIREKLGETREKIFYWLHVMG